MHLKKLAEKKTGSELQRHVFETYISLRFGIAVLAMLFPVLVVVAGLAHGIPIQSSLSAYYAPSHYIEPEGSPFVARTWFVGSLWALGLCLYLYKGFNDIENRLLNVAGLCGPLVALMPFNWRPFPGIPVTPHALAAILLFLCVAVVSIFCSEATFRNLDVKRQAFYRTKYKIAGTLMVVSPLLASITALLFDNPGTAAAADNARTSYFIIAIEAIGCWAFGYYWYWKSKELQETGAEKEALVGVA